MGFGLICRTWAFLITHNRPLGRADWAFILHPRLASKRPECLNGHAQRIGPSSWAGVKRSECFNGHASPLGLASELASPFFKPYQLPPSPCVWRAWARAVTFLISDAISTCLLGAGLVRA